MKEKFLLLLLVSGLPFLKLAAQPVTIKESGNTVSLTNRFVTVSFTKTNADLNSIISAKGTNLLGAQGRGYLLGPGFSMSPSQFSVVRQTPELVEIAFFHKASNHFQYDLHYIMRNNVPGVYCFLYQTHHAGDSAGTYGQTRWGIRGDEQNYDYHLVRDTIQGPMPKMAELQGDSEIQDWTFKLPDGTIYTKYNYADYIEGRHVHGMAGQKSGQGLFVIQASHEYLNGGPTKQYQNVHSNPYLICMFNCGHFLSDVRKSDDRITDEWAKLDGPFLLYLNEGNSVEAIWKDAKQQSEREMAQWPYSWMQHADYPLQRGMVTGKLTLDKKPAPDTHIILAADGYDWQAQTRGYIYSTRTNGKGEFILEHVRAGNYTLYVYGDNQTEEYRQNNIAVAASKTIDAGTIDWKPAAGNLLWQLGIADRTTKGFKYSDHKRTYGLFDTIPATVDYTVGKSHEATDWYYAQTKKGEWKIEFDVNKELQGTAMLTLAIAGAAKNPTLNVLVNGQPSGSFRLGNDASVYRSAILGGYYQQKEIRFPVALLKQGANTITLSLPDVKPGGGVMYDAIKLEIFNTDHAQLPAAMPYSIDKQLFAADFNNGYDSALWKAEIAKEANSLVYVKQGKLVLDTKGGVTVWLNKQLSGNVMIEYKRKVIMDSGINDRLSDLNNFWMSSDPRRNNLFTRNGVLEEYDSLQLYYVGMGGNSNKTTRFRKYTGTGDRDLIQEYTDSAHLLSPNKEYTIRIIVKDGTTQYLVNDELYFSYTDTDPLTKGYFGFRSTKSRQEIDDVRVYAIK